MNPNTLIFCEFLEEVKRLCLLLWHYLPEIVDVYQRISGSLSESASEFSYFSQGPFR